MKGKSRFSSAEAEQIRDLLGRKTRADRHEQKMLRSRLRRIGFFISDFTDSVDAFSRADFDALVSRGMVEVLTTPSMQESSPRKHRARAWPQAPQGKAMEEAGVVEALAKGPICSAAEAQRRVPAGPGYYAIFIDDQSSLPEPFRGLLSRRATRVLYIGIATRSLRERLVGQDLRHDKPSTFFRGIGPILGYRPPVGSLVGRSNQRNYRFTPDDTVAIVDWINKHLSVAWVQADPASAATEKSAIRRHRPLLNSMHNPEALEELAELRRECRRIATVRR